LFNTYLVDVIIRNYTQTTIEGVTYVTFYTDVVRQRGMLTGKVSVLQFSSNFDWTRVDYMQTTLFNVLIEHQS